MKKKKSPRPCLQSFLHIYISVYLHIYLFYSSPSPAEQCRGSDTRFLPRSASPDPPASLQGRKVPLNRWQEAPCLRSLQGGDKHETAHRHGFLTILQSVASDLHGCFRRACLHSCLLWVASPSFCLGSAPYSISFWTRSVLPNPACPRDAGCDIIHLWSGCNFLCGSGPNAESRAQKKQ